MRAIWSEEGMETCNLILGIDFTRQLGCAVAKVWDLRAGPPENPGPT